MIRIIGFLLLVFCLLSSCGGDKMEGSSYDLEGKWDIYEAYRDGDLTTTLEDGYFEFKDTILETNIMGSPISGAFTMNKNTFNHNSALAAEYEIAEFTGDTMHLETEIRKYNFLFKLQRERDTLPQSK